MSSAGRSTLRAGAVDAGVVGKEPSVEALPQELVAVLEVRGGEPEAEQVSAPLGLCEVLVGGALVEDQCASKLAGR